MNQQASVIGHPSADAQRNQVDALVEKALEALWQKGYDSQRDGSGWVIKEPLGRNNIRLESDAELIQYATGRPMATAHPDAGSRGQASREYSAAGEKHPVLSSVAIAAKKAWSPWLERSAYVLLGIVGLGILQTLWIKTVRPTKEPDEQKVSAPATNTGMASPEHSHEAPHQVAGPTTSGHASGTMRVAMSTQGNNPDPAKPIDISQLDSLCQAALTRKLGQGRKLSAVPASKGLPRHDPVREGCYVIGQDPTCLTVTKREGMRLLNITYESRGSGLAANERNYSECDVDADDRRVLSVISGTEKTAAELQLKRQQLNGKNLSESSDRCISQLQEKFGAPKLSLLVNDRGLQTEVCYFIHGKEHCPYWSNGQVMFNYVGAGGSATKIYACDIDVMDESIGNLRVVQTNPDIVRFLIKSAEQ